MSAKWASFCLGLKVLTDWSTGLEYINMCRLVGAEMYWNKQTTNTKVHPDISWYFTLNANNLISMVLIYAEVTLWK